MTDQMSTSGVAETEPTVEIAAAPSRKKSSTAAKLLQAAALAALLVPLGSVAAEANPCSFGTGSGSCFNNAGGEGYTLFEFADPTYKVGLRFTEIIGDFTVEMTATELTEAQALAKMANFPGYQPVPIGSNPLAPYIDFGVLAPAPCTTDEECSAPGTNTWRSDDDPGTRGPGVDFGYDIRIYWLAATDGMFPDPRVLHATGGNPLYDIDISDGSYSTEVPCDIFDECGSDILKAPGDPAAGGRDDMFTTFGLGDATAAVPEPASLVLLGTGISGLLYRRRRRKQDAR